ncbi:MAG: helix-turn-helix domain-containing protein, partial [Bacteroidaceae bacterium]|nr:helix-turn-helix domain-containing protein [Bacteroidaceae bacterium]
MALNRQRLDEVAKPRPKENERRSMERAENREWMRMSQDIALGIHRYLRLSNMTQREFAERMGVSPAYVGKLLKGLENLTLETIWKIQELIGVSFFSFPFRYSEVSDASPVCVAEDGAT